jgi:hypothetical protein
VWSRLAALVRDRLLLAQLAGAAVWLGWLIGLAMGGWTYTAQGRSVGNDHVQYYVVGQLLNEGTPERIYDAQTMRTRQAEIGGPGWQGYLPFRYPPFYALCFAPTSRLPYEVSWLIWTALGLALWLASGRLLRVPCVPWLVWSACFFPVFAAVSFGQNSLISLGILTVAAVLWLGHPPVSWTGAGRRLAAGLVAGLLAYKPQLALGLGLLWICDVRRSWPALLGLAATTAGLAALGWFAIPEAYRAYRDFLGENLVAHDRMSMAWHMGSQAFWQLLLPGYERVASLLSLATSAAGLAVFVVLWWRLRRQPPLALAVAILMTPWLTPYIMVYDWCILLVPAVLLWHHAATTQTRDRWLVLMALVWLVALAAGPLVLGQLRISPMALHPALPALVGVVLAARAGLSDPSARAR